MRRLSFNPPVGERGMFILIGLFGVTVVALVFLALSTGKISRENNLEQGILDLSLMSAAPYAPDEAQVKSIAENRYLDNRELLLPGYRAAASDTYSFELKNGESLLGRSSRISPFSLFNSISRARHAAGNLSAAIKVQHANFIFILDKSDSMNEIVLNDTGQEVQRIQLLRAAMYQVLDFLFDTNSRHFNAISIIGFGKKAHTLLDYTANPSSRTQRNKLKDQIEDIIQDEFCNACTTTGTALPFALNRARDVLSQEKDSKVTSYVIVLSDGIPTTVYPYDYSVHKNNLQKQQEYNQDIYDDSHPLWSECITRELDQIRDFEIPGKPTLTADYRKEARESVREQVSAIYEANELKRIYATPIFTITIGTEPAARTGRIEQYPYQRLNLMAVIAGASYIPQIDPDVDEILNVSRFACEHTYYMQAYDKYGADPLYFPRGQSFYNPNDYTVGDTLASLIASLAWRMTE